MMNPSEIHLSTAGTHPSFSARSPRLAAWWTEHTVRTQLMLAFVAITLLASSVAAAILVLDARQRTFAEMSGAVDIAEGFIREITRDVRDRETAENLSGKLAAQLGQVRHVRITVLYHRDAGIQVAALDGATEGPPTSSMMKLLGLVTKPRNVPVYVANVRAATVVITGNPTDEFNEAFAGLRTIATIWLGTNVGIFAILYVVIGHLLRPLESVSAGMSELRNDREGVRIAEPRARELQTIVASFNHLASSLEQVRGENARLFRQIIVVQEEERRRIAGELHDEVGPCIFGIMANLSSIEKASAALPDDERSRVAKRLVELREICDRLKQTNRALLNRLYPVAAGHITLSALIRKLVGEFTRRYPDVGFDASLGALADSYGEERDLLIYRAIQEGLTNALRHGQASRIEVSLSPSTDHETRSIDFEITDNGNGADDPVRPGFGLLTMKKRVAACGGSLTLSPNGERGMRLHISLPLSVATPEQPHERNATAKEGDV